MASPRWTCSWLPTVSFRLLWAQHSRRWILGLGVTAHPTAEWLANQLAEALGWEPAPGYLIRDRDACYGSLFVRESSLSAFTITRRHRVRPGKRLCGAPDRLDPSGMP